MKYIRVKSRKTNEQFIYKRSNVDNCFLNIANEIIIDQADTIEELCDCLMFVYENDKILITEVNNVNLMLYQEGEKCFGCIKIKLSNGAIRIEPMAIRNNEGELELI